MAQLKDSQVVGDLRVTGEIIGDVNGDLYGNVSGNLYGNVSGNLYGNVSGNLYGNVSGDLHGVADKVQNSFTLQIKDGTTEGRNKYTFNGETAKTLNIKAADSNTVLTTSADGELIIQTKNTNTKVTFKASSGTSSYPLALGYSLTSATSDYTNYARFTPKVFCKPSDGSLTSSGTITAKNGFVGNLTGIASKAYPHQIGEWTAPIYWDEEGIPKRCSDLLSVSITGSAKKYDTSFTGDNSIYDSFRYTGITAHINASINEGGYLVVSNSSCYTTVHGVTQELTAIPNNQQGSLMHFLGFSPNGAIPPMFQNADTIFIILTGNATYTVISTNLFDTGFRTGFRKRLIMNNCINAAVTISLKNGKSNETYLIVKGEQKTLAASGTAGYSFDITLPGKSSHIYDIYTPGPNSMIFLQDF